MNYRRARLKGGTYFFTVNLHDRSSALIQILTNSIRHVRVLHPFQTLAIVVLPDHLHCIWQLPEEDDDYSIRWSLIKATFTRNIPFPDKKYHRSTRGERQIWQKRFWEHLIRDEGDLNNHIAYIHNNPVKHGHVCGPEFWPYSTWHRHHRF